MYLRPEITAQPQAPAQVYTGQTLTLASHAEGKYLTYQWKRDGVDLTGETNATLVVTEASASLHDGNYSVVVSNDFGSVASQSTSLQVEAASMATTHVVDLNATVAMEMLWVEPGTFTMGSPTSEVGRNADEDEHSVTLTKGFYLGKYEVTQAQYEAVMTGNSNQLSTTPSQYSGNDRPVEKVSWNDVQVFLTRLNAAEQAAGRLPAGSEYVLPTESEWEYACRAGTTTTYSWGNDINSSNANYDQSGIGQTRDVGQYAANPWGFFDMHGNVFEWTADWYLAAYPTGSVTDPTGPASGSNRVTRGGSWHLSGSALRSARRSSTAPGSRYDFLGFRVGFKASQ
jgi:formylglycine-generating enzyme required for sulfatase activity